jgi:hypothetical protein
MTGSQAGRTIGIEEAPQATKLPNVWSRQGEVL